MLSSPICCRKHRKTCFLVKQAWCQGWNLWFPGVSQTWSLGGVQGGTKSDTCPVRWKWLLPSGGGPRVPRQAPALQSAGDIQSQKLFWLVYWMCYCPRQPARGPSHTTSHLWAPARQIPTSPNIFVENWGWEFLLSKILQRIYVLFYFGLRVLQTKWT